MKDTLLIPEERVGVVKDKKFKNKLESELKVKIKEYGNSIELEGEGLDLYNAKNIIKAVARGFSPQNAFRLLNEDEELEIINLAGDSDKKIKVIKSRLIGTKGKTRKMIEKYSGCSVSIYGKTVSIIGTHSQMEVAEEAIKMLIYGAKHSTVYNFLIKAKVV